MDDLAALAGINPYAPAMQANGAAGQRRAMMAQRLMQTPAPMALPQPQLQQQVDRSAPPPAQNGLAGLDPAAAARMFQSTQKTPGGNYAMPEGKPDALDPSMLAGLRDSIGGMFNEGGTKGWDYSVKQPLW